MQKIRNILTVDVENWYCNPAFSHEEWASLPDRAVSAGRATLELMSLHNVTGTFFVNGILAQKHPDLIREIAALGHEIAAHGMLHRAVYTQTRASFRSDIDCCKKLLEDITGHEVRGYRAPMFTITRQSRWAWEILKDVGYSWSSSVFPVKNPVYGWPGFQEEFKALPGTDCVEVLDGFIEIPMTTLFSGIPACGGFWLRAFPMFVTISAISRKNRKNLPAIVYIHPWELDPNTPVAAMPLKWAVAHYWRLGSMTRRVSRLLEMYSFCRAGDYLSSLPLHNIQTN